MREADAGIHDRRDPIPVVVLAASAALLLAFIAWPTVDHDEGYFFQAALHATKTGLPGFPWADAYYGAHHLYLPLNSLTAILNWPLAYLPRSWWLPAGRLLSAAAVCAGVLLLYGEQRRNAPSLWQHGILLFLATCLPLILCGRMIRPDGVAFLGVCAALVLASKSGRAAAFGAGVAVSLVALAHAVHGFLAGCMVLGYLALMPVPAPGAAGKRILLYCLGAAIPAALFYGAYAVLATPASLWRDISLLLRFAPRSVHSLSPGANISAWAAWLRGQANMWPLLLFAILAVLAPTAPGPRRRAIRFLKVAISGVLVFWIFFYPKKEYPAVVPLLPGACLVLFSAAAGCWPRVLGAGLAVGIAANAALVVRYHWRLLGQPSGMQQLAPIARALATDGGKYPHAAVMGKLWLVFALPRDTTLWDITIFPVLAKAGDGEAAIGEAIRRSDAVVLERWNGSWVDHPQIVLARHMLRAGWRRQSSLRIDRYFIPFGIEIFTPPAR